MAVFLGALVNVYSGVVKLAGKLKLVLSVCDGEADGRFDEGGDYERLGLGAHKGAEIDHIGGIEHRNDAAQRKRRPCEYSCGFFLTLMSMKTMAMQATVTAAYIQKALGIIFIIHAVFDDISLPVLLCGYESDGQ